MSVTIANVIHNHRGLYFEATGDGSTTALTVNHMNGVHSNTTATATVVTAPTAFHNGKSGNGGFVFPVGTSAPVTSVSVTSTAVTVNTTSAIGNGTKAYVAVVFDQSNATE